MQSPETPPVLHIVGRKRAGKTELMIRLIRSLSAQGYRVAGVRHSPHNHLVDAEGSDTAAYKKAGAIGAALITARETNLFYPAAGWDEKFLPVRHTFNHCHLILVEGGMKEGKEKIEIVPPGESPLLSGDCNLRAVVSDHYSAPDLPSFKPDEVEQLCSFIEERYIRAAISGAIMAGGRSSRLGVNKAFLKFHNRPAVELVLEKVSALVSPVVVITNSPAEFRYLNISAAPDIRPGCGPLSGIHTALSLSSTEYVLVVSCDLPLITAQILRALLSAYPGYDITLYKHAQFEPLCAVYCRTCLPALEELIDHGEYRIIDLFPTLNVKVIRTEQKEVFQSINTPEDYQRLQEKYGRD
jgi:molybdopterin-guanine dinucleotide biosynthesis protein MobB